MPHLRPIRPISQMISTITSTTTIIPDHTPALKISPITVQLENINMIKGSNTPNVCFFI